MTFPISPGVYDREIDASVTTIQAPGAPGAFVANLEWGPVLKRKVISSEEQLKQIYSRPFLQNNYDFLLASQFLSYSNNLLVTRVSNGNNSISGRSVYVPPDVIDDPCAGATTNIIIDVSAEYDVYINDELIVRGNREGVFNSLLTAQGLVWDTSGLLTSYRVATARLRFERTDGQAVTFESNGNPTASLAGSVLSFCLAGVGAGVFFAPTATTSFDGGLVSTNSETCGETEGGGISLGYLIGNILPRTISFVCPNIDPFAESAGVGYSFVFDVTNLDKFVTYGNFAIDETALVAFDQTLTPTPAAGESVNMFIESDGVTVRGVKYPIITINGYFVVVVLILSSKTIHCQVPPIEVVF